MKRASFHLLTLAVVGLVLIVTLSAQAQNCNLSISVYRFKDIPTEELIDDVTIVLSHKARPKKKVKPVSKERNGYFENLVVGEYRLTLTKKGFKQTLDSFTLSCKYATAGTVDEVKFLWEGDSKEKVDLDAMGSRYPTGTMLRAVDGPGGLNKATHLPQPVYPAAARAVRASGAVEVEVLLNELGKVVWAEAVSGNFLLRHAAVTAARGAKFRPTTLQGMPVKVLGRITYNFVP